MTPVYRISAIATFPAIKGDEWQQLTKRAVATRHESWTLVLPRYSTSMEMENDT